MQLEITGWQIDTLKQALQESDSLWEDRIQQAERGERPNLSIDGARMMQDDLRAILEQINQKITTFDSFVCDPQIEDDWMSFYENDQDLEAFSLECAFGPEE